MGVIQRQSIINTVVIYTGILVGFVNMLYIQPQFLLPEEIGLTRVLYSFSALLAVFMPIGAGNILVRYFPKYRDDERGHNGFIGMLFAYALLSYLVFAVGLFIAKDAIASHYQEQSKLFADNFWLVFPFSFFLVFLQIFNVYSFSLSKSIFPSFFSEVIVRLLNIVVIVLYHYNILSFHGFITAFTAIYGINFLAVGIYVFSVNRFKMRFKLSMLDKDTRKKLWLFGLTMAVAALASLGLKSVDMVVLGRYDLKAAGVYSIALFIGLFIETPLSSLDRIAGARMAIAIAHNNQKEISDIYHKSSNNLFLIGGFLFLGVNTCITPLLSFLPAVYRGNELIVLIVSLGSLVNMASGSNTSIIYNSEHYKKGTYMLAGVFILLVGLLSVLVPKYGILGAAISIAIGTSAYNIGKLLFIRHYFNMQPFGLNSLTLLLVIVAMFLVGQYLPHLPNVYLNFLYRGSIVCGAYLGITYMLKLIPEELLKPARKYLPI